MVEGKPVDFEECRPRYWGKGMHCSCGLCAVCGKPKHMGIHGGVVGKPGMVWGHEFEPQGRAPIDTRKDHG